MIESIHIDGKEYPIVKRDGICPVCDTPMKEVCWSWNMFHGEASSSCCGSPYQIKGWYVENASEEMVAFMDKLGKDYFYLKIKLEYIVPINEVLKELGKKKIDKKVVALAEEKLKKDYHHLR